MKFRWHNLARSAHQKIRYEFSESPLCAKAMVSSESNRQEVRVFKKKLLWLLSFDFRLVSCVSMVYGVKFCSLFKNWEHYERGKEMKVMKKATLIFHCWLIFWWSGVKGQPLWKLHGVGKSAKKNTKGKGERPFALHEFKWYFYFNFFQVFLRV